MQTDVVIVGAGPAGIFTAIEMIRKGSKQKIVIVEKGQPIEKRFCPKAKTQQVRGLQALLPYHHRLFRRGRIFGRQALAEL